MADAIPTRTAYRDAVVELMAERTDQVCLDTDTGLFTGVDFADAEERYIDVGIAEHTLVGMAAGMAAGGWFPWIHTFAAFATSRAAEAIKLDVSYPKLPVRIVGTHGGVSAGHMGPSHQALEDLAMMRCLPGMTVVVPPDAPSVAGLVRQLADVPGPAYLRLGRKATPDLPEWIPAPELGRAQVLHATPAGADSALLVATGGPPLHAALEAAERLRGEGYRVGLLHIHTLKPLDTETLLAQAAGAGVVVTVEEHWQVGGLGSLVAETLAERCPRRVLRIGLADDFVRSVGTQEELLAEAGVTADGICTAVRSAVGRPEKGDPR